MYIYWCKLQIKQNRDQSIPEVELHVLWLGDAGSTGTMSKWLCLFFKMPNFSVVQSAPSYNLGKVIHDSSLRQSYLLLSLGVSVEFSAMAAFWQTPCSRLIYSLPYPRALQKNHFLGGNEASGNPLRCFGSVPGRKGMSQPGAVQTFSFWFRTESGVRFLQGEGYRHAGFLLPFHV